MKTLILSDIHANIYALEAIWAKEKDADRVLCLGDLVDYGPRPKPVIDWVRSQPNITCVQGNHDRWLATCYRQGLTMDAVAPEDRYWVHYNVGLVDEDDIAFLEGLPLEMTVELDGITYGMSHMYRKYEEIVSLHAYHEFCTVRLGAEEGAVKRLLFGHTHRQGIRYLSDDMLWLNPGSAAYRRRDDPDQTAHYATLIDGQITLHRLPYDFAPVFETMNPVPVNAAEKCHVEGHYGTRPDRLSLFI